ncbi:MAG: DoxX family protein [Myxococcales bacterium]
MSQDLGRLLLRLGIGGMLFLHGLSKIEHGIAFIEGMMHGHGLPAFFAWGVYLGEVVAPACLVLGLWTRLAGLVCALDMIAAIALVHLKQLGDLGPAGGWAVELPMLYLVGSLAAALLGGGRYAAGRGQWS